MRSIHHDAVRRGESFRHAQLLAVLICFHVASPLVQVAMPAVAVFLLLPLYFVVLGSATMAMSTSRKRSVLGVLAVPVAVAAVICIVVKDRESLILSASTLPFLSYAASVVFLSVLRPGAVDQARLLGSACVFILMAQVWAACYSVLELLSPGAFIVPGAASVQVGDLTYLSFVTQTTLGYGDVTPVSPVARSLATLQATAGIFYMGVIVARFAGRLEVQGRSIVSEIGPNSGRVTTAPDSQEAPPDASGA